MMAGQISWCPIEETINGTLVFDAAIFPPTDMGAISENVKLTLENGRVTKIEGGKEAERFSAWRIRSTIRICSVWHTIHSDSIRAL